MGYERRGKRIIDNKSRRISEIKSKLYFRHNEIEAQRVWLICLKSHSKLTDKSG